MPVNNRSKYVVLPGLDGTGKLLTSFVDLAPDGSDLIIISFPDEPTQSYEDLCDYVCQCMVGIDRCTLIAESFSGPIGVLVANRLDQVVEKLVLVATFIRRPVPLFAKWIPWSIIFRLPLPNALLTYLLLGRHSEWTNKLASTIKTVSPNTLASRIGCLLDVDVSDQLSGLSCKVLYLRASNDRVVSNRNGDEVKRILPSTTIHEIDSPHLILQTHPETAWRFICQE